MGAAGTELSLDSPGKPKISPQGGAKSGAVDAELREIATLWTHLPATARTAMLALAKAAARVPQP
jgi:hypothetical protein